MNQDILQINSPLCDGIDYNDRIAVLGCLGYHIRNYQKDEIVILEGDDLKHVGIVLSGAVNMVKEDLWGNRITLLNMEKDDLFGETFACGDDSTATVSFIVSQDARILFLSFPRVMRSCTMSCDFHHQLTDNMVRIIANKNRSLIHKVEVVSKRSIREKLLAYLSLHAQSQQSRYFEIPLGRMELAEYLCVDRSALTRELVKMKIDGLIDYDKNWFRIL